MLVSMNWIKDFVDLEGIDVDGLINRFTLSTAEVEGVIKYGYDTKGVVVGRIENIEKHPKSEKLKIVKVMNGTFPHYPQVSPQAMPGKTPGKRGDFESCGIYPHPPGEK